MSAKQRVIKAADDLTDIQSLLRIMTNNPNAINEWAAKAREEVTLTEAQENKYKEANEFMGKVDSIQAQLAARENALALERKEHERKVAEHQKNVTEFARKIEDAKHEYSIGKKELEEKAAKITDAQKKAELQNSVAESAMRSRENAVQKREDACKRREDALAAEDSRLTVLRDSITKKAQLLAQAIG